MDERELVRRRTLFNFASRIGHEFSDPALLDEALTHSSYAHERGLPYWNERLEFLGDAVLEVLISEWLFRERVGATEGELTRERASLVREEALSAWGDALGVGGLLRVGKGARERLSANMIGDAVEAVIGAIYLDGGLEAARAFLHARPDESLTLPRLDPKSRLQILCQRDGGEVPVYELLGREGPDHLPVFTARVLCGGRELGRGTGGSRKLAEQNAALAALEHVQSGPEK